jgi:serpin B
MGVKAAFDAREADLSDMWEYGGNSGLAVEKVFHKAVLEVDQEGTEAAASTAFFIKQCGTVMSDAVPLDFVADHPFSFFVVEEVSGAVVFAGHVLDPAATSV